MERWCTVDFDTEILKVNLLLQPVTERKEKQDAKFI